MIPVAISTGLALLELVPKVASLFDKEDSPPVQVLERVTSIAKAVTGKETNEDALEAIKSDPEMLAKYKDATEARALELAKAYLLDTQSARQRDIEIQRVRGSNRRADYIVLLTVIGIGICIFLAVRATDLDDFAKSIINIAIGVFLANWQQINAFEFGTSRTSKDKDATIKGLSNGNGHSS